MNLTKTLLATTALTVAAGMAHSEDMTIVSWGGAYSKSQQNAYHTPLHRQDRCKDHQR